jgi:hypothetical protein
MKLLNIDPNKDSIFIGDIGNDRNGGPYGRKQNQARYIPTGLDVNDAPDTTLAIQLVETGAVKKSAVDGEISTLVTVGKLQILSVDEDLERTVVVTKTGAPISVTQVFWNDLVFGRPIHILSLKSVLNAAPDTGKDINYRFKRNNANQTSALFDHADVDGVTITFDVSGITFADGFGNAWDYNDTLDLELSSSAGDTVGLTSATVTVTYSLDD